MSGERWSPSAAWSRAPIDDSNFLSLAEVGALGARAFMDAQRALDARADAARRAWDETGIPPTNWEWSAERLQFTVAFAVRPKTSAGSRTELLIAPRMRAGTGRMVLAIRRRDAPEVAGNDPE